MTDHVITAPSGESRAGRFQRAEQALWDRYGLHPTTRFVSLESPRARLRVLEFGSGRPVLFVHGTVGPGAWAPLIGRMHGARSLVLERPGWGLSEPVDYSKQGYRAFVAGVLSGVLDALDVDRVDVVGGSIGDVWALSLAEHHPDRVGRIVLLGGGPIVSEVRVPGVIRALASPIGALMVRLPLSADRLRSTLRQSGHSASLEDGRVADEFFQWRLATATDTASMRNERDMVRSIIRGWGWQPGFVFDDEQLAQIDQPTLLIYGTADPTGSVDIWRRVTGALPHGELQLIEAAGHHPWFEDERLVAEQMSRFLVGPAGS